MKYLFFAFITLLGLSNNTSYAQTAPADHSTMVQYATLEGYKGNAYYIPSASATGNVLIIYHDSWGLTQEVKKEAQRWQAKLGNVDVYAIDMYDGKWTADRDMAKKYREELNEKHADNLTKGLLSKIGLDKRIITLGWGAGGTWAFKAAMLAGKQAAGCVMYYAMPEKEDKKIRDLQCDVLYLWASRDPYVQKFFVEEFGRKVKNTKHEFEMHEFDAATGFANPIDPDHTELVKVEADRYALEFMKKRFQVE
jgi:carboxymethylenebutenolidase